MMTIRTSAHAARKARPATTPMPLRATGSTTSTSARSFERPSSHEASSSWRGTVSKKFFMSQIRNGSSIAAWMSTRPM